MSNNIIKSFTEWYKNNVYELNTFMQIVMWCVYGFIWIPILFCLEYFLHKTPQSTFSAWYNYKFGNLNKIIHIILWFLAGGIWIPFLFSLENYRKDIESVQSNDLKSENIKSYIIIKTEEIMNDVEKGIKETFKIPNEDHIEEETDRTEYATFWRRVIAVLIDTIIMYVAGAILGMTLGLIIAFALIYINIIKGYTGVKVVGFLTAVILNWLYFTISESSKKQSTLGKRAVGIVVTDIKESRISFGKANARYWAKGLSAASLFMGFVMAAFTQRKQALHDIVASTLVVHKKRRYSR